MPSLPREAVRTSRGKSQPGSHQQRAESRALLPSAGISPLVDLLSAEQAVYEELLDVAGQERDAIVEGKLPRLKLVVERKQEILSALADLEEQRVSWVRRYARRNSLDIDTLTLSAVIQRCEGDDRRLLTRLHRSLTRRISHIVELDQVTRSLLQSILKSIDGSLRYLLLDESAGQTYAPQGRLLPNVVASRQLLDRRV